MPTHVGPNISGEENLVFGYNLSDQKNSYLGEPTTNQANTDYARTIQFHNQGSYNNAGTISDAPEKGTDWKKIVITDRGNNFRIAQFPYIIQTYGTTKVYSVEYDFGLTSGYFFYGDGSSGFGVLQDDGKRTTARFTPPSSSDWYEALFLGNNTPASGINDTIYYRYYQVEEKSYPTRYTPTSRSSTQGLLDLKGTSTINISTTSFDNSSQLIFDGTDDYVNVPHNDDHSFSGDFTIESVIYPTSNTANCIIQKGSGSDYFQEYWLLQDMRGSNRYISLIMGKNGNSDANYIETTNISVLNTYHHIIATVNGNTATIYVNGEQKTTGTISNRIQSSNDIRIGWRVDGFAATSGKIPLVKLYNRSLSPSEVLNNYNNIKRKYGI